MEVCGKNSGKEKGVEVLEIQQCPFEARIVTARQDPYSAVTSSSM